MEKLPTDSARLSKASNDTLEKLIEAKKGASRLLGCYRTGDANDPETYISAVVSVLSRYEIEIIKTVTEPATGLPAKLKWLPSIAEIREECDILAARKRRVIERENQIREQLEARKTLQITDGRPRKTYEQLQAELAEVGIFIGKDRNGPKAMKVEDFQHKYGITKEQWDAIPNAPKGN